MRYMWIPVLVFVMMFGREDFRNWITSLVHEARTCSEGLSPE